MGRIMSFGQDGRMVADFDKSEHDFLRRYGRTPDEVMAENAKMLEFAAATWELLTCNEPNFVWSGLQKKARELGVEV